MDSNDCQTIIPAARDTGGRSTAEILGAINAAAAQFGKNAKAKFQRGGEW